MLVIAVLLTVCRYLKNSAPLKPVSYKPCPFFSIHQDFADASRGDEYLDHDLSETQQRKGVLSELNLGYQTSQQLQPEPRDDG